MGCHDRLQPLGRAVYKRQVEDYDSLSREGIADLLYDRGMDVLNDKEQSYGCLLYTSRCV